MIRQLALALHFALALAWTSSAQANTTQECVDAHVSAQELRKESALLEARLALAQCGAADCPGILRSECAAWLSEVDSQIPSMVPVLITSDGSPAEHVTMTLDEDQKPLALGVAFEANPGSHLLRVEATGFETTTLHFVANSGDQGQRIEVRLSPVRRAMSPWPYVAWGSGVALGLGTFASFGLLARSGEKDLARECEPSCKTAELEVVRRNYLLANIGVGIAAASAVGGGIHYTIARSRLSVRPQLTGSVVEFSSQF